MPIDFTMQTTPHQRAKLAEMIEAFWPDKYGPRTCGEDGMVETNSFPKIHWFELCMTSLPDRILGRFPSEAKVFGGVNGFMTTLVVSEHPIDYLYHEFQTNMGGTQRA
jgi:hypothetical protein